MACRPVMIALLLGMAFASPAQAGPVVLELFTSQGCSSCPPADALLTMLSADKDVLPLSFHIDYWDSPAWTDPFALPASSGRQRAYAHALGLDNVFTPQLIVDGTQSMVGSDEGQVRQTLQSAEAKDGLSTLLIAPSDHGLVLTLPSTVPAGTDLWEVRFKAQASTSIQGGENGGRTLQSVNNVTSIKNLGPWQPGNSPLDLPPLKAGEDGVAVLAQLPGQGRILGSGVYPSKQ
jgi:hypothetical protein